MGILAAILAALRAIPALEGIINTIFGEINANDAAAKAKEVQDRKAAKDTAVDDAIAAAQRGVSQPTGPVK